VPPVFDLEYYARLKPGPGTGPGRSLSALLTYAIRERATTLSLGPRKDPKVTDAACWIFVEGAWRGLTPPSIAVTKANARFLKQLVAGNGTLTLKIGERTLDVDVEFTFRDYADEITVTLPVSSALQGPAARVYESILGSDGYLEYEDAEFEDEFPLREPRRGFQLQLKGNKLGWDGAPFLGRRRMPFHPDMHAPTKFLVMILMLCFRDRAGELEFRPGVDELWTRYLVDKWYECVPPPAFVWPQLVRVIERHAILIRPESSDLDVPAVGWLELRWGQDLPPDNLAVFLDPRKDSAHLRIKFLRVDPEKPTESKTTDASAQVDEDPGDDSMMVEFSPDDQ